MKHGDFGWIWGVLVSGHLWAESNLNASHVAALQVRIEFAKGERVERPTPAEAAMEGIRSWMMG